MKYKFTFLLFLTCLTLAGQTTNNNNPKRQALLSLYAQLLVHPQEKIYVQTDRPYYINGEKIFFRAFLQQAASREPSGISRYVYTELLTEKDSVALRQQIRMDEQGAFYGALSLPETLPQGNYRIRAYTRYLGNSGEAFFYSRPVFIADPTADKTASVQPHSPTSTVVVNIPEAKPNTYTLQAEWENNRLSVTVNKPEGLPETTCYLLIHRQGVPTYLEEWDFSKANKAWNKSEFASGVSHLMLFDEAFQLLSERLIFVDNKDGIGAKITTDKPTYKPREKVVLEIQLAEMPEDSIPCSFAISITDDQDIKLDTATNIRAEFLLASELKPQINHPASYFQNDDAQTVKAVDQFLQTPDSRQYNVAAALQQNLQKPTIKPEASYSFSGLLKGPRGKPYKNGKIQISSVGYDFKETVLSDDKGRYLFEEFEFPDSTAYFFLSYTNEKTDKMDIIPDPITYPSVTIPWNYGEKIDLSNAALEAYIDKANRKYLNEHGMREVFLQDVVVKGRQAQKKDKRVDNLGFESDRWISSDKIRESPPTTFDELFSMLPGVQVEPDKVTVRGKEVTFLLNGSPFGHDYLELSSAVNVTEIAQVDLFMEIAKTLVFGTGGPVIALTTWRPGTEPEGVSYKNKFRLLPLGYQRPIEFYSPQYDTPEQRNNPIPDLRSTIYWNPKVVPDNNGKARIEFYTADSPSTYSVVIEGIGRHKTLIYHKEDAAVEVK